MNSTTKPNLTFLRSNLTFCLSDFLEVNLHASSSITREWSFPWQLVAAAPISHHNLDCKWCGC